MFSGRVALVTGAARGQGRSHCVRLAEEGAHVVALDICGPVQPESPYPPATAADLDETVRQVTAAGGEALAVQADVRDAAAVEAAVATGVERFGRLDIVFANAGVWSFGRAWEITPQAWAAVVDTNLTGVFHTVRAAVNAMLPAATGGAIVITSSIAGLKASPHLAHYSAAKHGLIGLMKAFAFELGPHRIRVNLVHPSGVADTGGADGSGDLAAVSPAAQDAMNAAMTDAGFMNANAHVLPEPMVEPADITEAAVWLASDRARYVTGISLPVDGGALLR